jgi:hypothetical protein
MLKGFQKRFYLYIQPYPSFVNLCTKLFYDSSKFRLSSLKDFLPYRGSIYLIYINVHAYNARVRGGRIRKTPLLLGKGA